MKNIIISSLTSLFVSALCVPLVNNYLIKKREARQRKKENLNLYIEILEDIEHQSVMTFKTIPLAIKHNKLSMESLIKEQDKLMFKIRHMYIFNIQISCYIKDESIQDTFEKYVDYMEALEDELVEWAETMDNEILINFHLNDKPTINLIEKLVSEKKKVS